MTDAGWLIDEIPMGYYLVCRRIEASSAINDSPPRAKSGRNAPNRRIERRSCEWRWQLDRD